jgi:predicted metal-dependent phosphoesterase TrpH
VIDLHCHTDCSDGSITPFDLLRQAIELDLEALAITDHDTLEGYDLAKGLAEEQGFDLVCGVELSTQSDRCSRSAHLLGYFFSDPGETFRAWLTALQEGRTARNGALQQHLRDLGMNISWQELQAIGKKQIGRPHFARLMFEKKYVVSIQEAFDHYLCEGGLAWVERDEPVLEKAVERVAHAGGIPSLAHPGRISGERSVLHPLIAALIPHGLKAIECFHPEHSDDDTRLCLQIAGEFDLAVTGGSDYHGSYKQEIALGTGRNGSLDLPMSMLADLRNRFTPTENRAAAIAIL